MANLEMRPDVQNPEPTLSFDKRKRDCQGQKVFSKGFNQEFLCKIFMNRF